MGARYYNPMLGRFLSIDPIEPDENNLHSLNRYAYANNNPYKFTDPDGENPFLVLLFFGLAANDAATGDGPVGGGLAKAGAKAAGGLATKGDDVTQAVAHAADRGAARAGESAVKNGVHKNSLDYVGETHVYRIKGPDGKTHKIGESAQGTRKGDGASIRGEQQARKLSRETGGRFESEIRKTFPDKASARDYETRVIERFRRMHGDNTLPGNKTNR